MSGTTKTSDQLKSVVARLLAYVDDSGNTLGTRWGASGLYVSQAPDSTSATRYGVVRKINTQSSPEYSNTSQLFDLEVMCYGRPRSSEQDVEFDADLAEGALLTWTESSSALGLTFARESQRDTLPALPDPYDRELVTVRLVVSCRSFAKYLINALT